MIYWDVFIKKFELKVTHFLKGGVAIFRFSFNLQLQLPSGDLGRKYHRFLRNYASLINTFG